MFHHYCGFWAWKIGVYSVITGAVFKNQPGFFSGYHLLKIRKSNLIYCKRSTVRSKVVFLKAAEIGSKLASFVIVNKSSNGQLIELFANNENSKERTKKTKHNYAFKQ
jgi:hypothetical protein